jgi:hypothetical protein
MAQDRSTHGEQTYLKLMLRFIEYIAENPITGPHSENPNLVFSWALLGNPTYMLAIELQGLLTDHSGQPEYPFFFLKDLETQEEQNLF